MRLLLAALLLGASPALADWSDTLAEARGQTVYWHAWGGDPRTNDFIAWASTQTEARYGVTIEQVKLTDTAEAVARVLAEQAAGQDTGGAVDLIWINGPNFLAMKEAGLLHGPFVADLPNARFVDLGPDAPASVDFTVPVEGYESPWRLAKFVFAHDAARAPEVPATMAGFVDWAAAHPGRMTHPNPANFMGASFLKQALVELAPDPAVLAQPVTDAAFAAQTAPLWAWYDALRPNLWRQGTAFPENESVQAQLLADGEVDVAMFFDPAAPAALIEQGSPACTRCVFSPPRRAASATFPSWRSRSTRPTAQGPRWWPISCWTRRRRRICRMSPSWAAIRCWTRRGWMPTRRPCLTRCPPRPPCLRWPIWARPCPSRTPAG